MRAAYTTFDRLGARRRLEMKTRGRLRALGVRLPAKRPAGATDGTALSPREHEILGLLGDGLRNAEIAELLVLPAIDGSTWSGSGGARSGWWPGARPCPRQPIPFCGG
jgi:hypothetical protein